MITYRNVFYSKHDISVQGIKIRAVPKYRYRYRQISAILWYRYQHRYRLNVTDAF